MQGAPQGVVRSNSLGVTNHLLSHLPLGRESYGFTRVSDPSAVELKPALVVVTARVPSHRDLRVPKVPLHPIEREPGSARWAPVHVKTFKSLLS